MIISYEKIIKQRSVIPKEDNQQTPFQLEAQMLLHKSVTVFWETTPKKWITYRRRVMFPKLFQQYCNSEFQSIIQKKPSHKIIQKTCKLKISKANWESLWKTSAMSTINQQ